MGAGGAGEEEPMQEVGNGEDGGTPWGAEGAMEGALCEYEAATKACCMRGSWREGQSGTEAHDIAMAVTSSGALYGKVGGQANGEEATGGWAHGARKRWQG